MRKLILTSFVAAACLGIFGWSTPEAKAAPIYRGGYFYPTYNYYAPAYSYNYGTYATPFGYQAYSGYSVAPVYTGTYVAPPVRRFYTGPYSSTYFNYGTNSYMYGPGYLNSYPTGYYYGY